MFDLEFNETKFKGSGDNLGFPTGKLRIPKSERSPKRDFDVPDFYVFDKFSPDYDFNLDVKRIKDNISNCGKWLSFYFYCKKCEEERKIEYKNEIPLNAIVQPLDMKRIQSFCGIRYCSNVGCITDRYSKIYTQLKNNKRIQGLKKMLHFAIGFEKINLDEFDIKRLRFERVIHTYIKRLKKVGVNIQAFKVLDISRGKRSKSLDGKYFVHYHFVAIPFKHDFNLYEVLQRERMLQMTKQKIKVPFHVQMFGLKKKESLLSYISLRSVGLYKSYEFKKDSKFEPKMLREQIENGEFMLLKDMFSLEDYMRLFFGRRFFATVGGLPYGSKVGRNLSGFLPDACEFHGDLAENDVRVEVRVEGVPDPPPLLACVCVHVPVCVRVEGVG